MRRQLLYWIPTAQVVLVMGAGGVVDVLQVESALQVLRQLGYPDYFSILLGVAKLLGTIALLAPVPRTLREWAYAGFTFDVGAAILSFLAVGAPPIMLVVPVYTLAMLMLSYGAWRQRERTAVAGALVVPEPQPT